MPTNETISQAAYQEANRLLVANLDYLLRSGTGLQRLPEESLPEDHLNETPNRDTINNIITLFYENGVGVDTILGALQKTLEQVGIWEGLPVAVIKTYPHYAEVQMIKQLILEEIQQLDESTK